MLLKVLILCVICVASTNALVQFLIGLDLVLSLISTGTDIAVNVKHLLPHYNQNSKDYTSDFQRITDTLYEIKNELHNLPQKTSEITNLERRSVDIAKYAKLIKDASDELPISFDVKNNKETIRFNEERLRKIVHKNIDEYRTELLGIGPLSYFTKMLESLQSGPPICRPKTIYTQVYELLQSYIATEVLASHVLINCFKAREYVERVNLNYEIEIEKEIFKNKTRDAIKIFKETLGNSSAYLTTCGFGGNNQKGSAYTYFASLFPKLLVTPYDLDLEYKKPSCPGYNRKGIRTNKRDGAWKLRQCSNAIVCTNANFFAAACVDNNDEERRFISVRHFRENKRYCEKGIYKTNCVVGSWDYTHRHDSRKCGELCDCICEDYEYDKSERHISLEEVTSNTKTNKVVVGVRFMKRNKILSIDIQEAELQPGATVKNGTFKWQSIKKTQRNNNASEFHQLKWFEGRAIMLDFMEVPSPEHCITGVRFRTTKIDSYDILTLEIQATKFKYSGRQLISDTSEWISYDYSKRISKNYDIRERDVPTRTSDSLRQNHGPATTVNFAPTSYFTEDAGQSTVPFIDLQEVTSSGLLSGLGLYLIDSPSTGGFIKIAVNEFNKAPYL